MSVSATEAVTPAGMYQASTSTSSSADKDMFLNLMVAQLRYQDPMNPADTGEFLAQNAQFTALEKMQNVADQTAALLAAQISFGASGLVGKNITFLREDGSTASGLVSSVTYDVTGPTLVVGDETVTLGQVQSIDADTTTDDGSGTDGSTTNTPTPNVPADPAPAPTTA